MAATVYEEYSKNTCKTEFSVEDDISEALSDSDFAERSGSSWIASFYNTAASK